VNRIWSEGQRLGQLPDLAGTAEDGGQRQRQENQRAANRD
jgi:hypothetical protein